MDFIGAVITFGVPFESGYYVLLMAAIYILIDYTSQFSPVD